MSDPGIKNVIIRKEFLPALSGENIGYVVRYRIVSEDRNRTSHWSPRHTLISSAIGEIPHLISTTPSVSDPTKVLVTATWTPPLDVDIRSYDIYVKINTNDWAYVGNTSSNSYSAIGTVGTTMSIAVQVPTYPKGRYIDATLFDSEGISL
jgi:hypothetical protein